MEDSARLPFFLYLLEQGATLQESESGHILFDACYNDSNLAIIEYIFEHNDMDINMRSNYKNQTLLMQTTYRGADDVCQFLLEKGADKSLMNSEGKTAYDMAVEAYDFAVESGNNERIESFQRIIELLEE